ncbi:MAG: alpha-L-fucosidase [Anaerolineae bacterium]|nr:alpha-L-fucosidase [Anaerolineae bacterium]
MNGEYKPTWKSLREHTTPQWFREAKFGIYTHWGIYAVPAKGPNATWYPYNMHREGTAQYLGCPPRESLVAMPSY